MNGFAILGILLGYYFIGALINGLMHRYDPKTFNCDAMTVGFVVQMWIVIVPFYWFAIFCDRCLYWFEKKGE